MCFSVEIIATLAELPLPVREFRENVILLGLWHSSKSPPVNILLDHVVDNIKKYRTSGILLKFEGSKCLHLRSRCKLPFLA